MTHAPHEFLDTYVEGAIFQDGCEECESRAKRFSVEHLDTSTWHRTRLRALTLELNGLTSASQCEIPVLRVIGQILLKEDRELQASPSQVNVDIEVPHSFTPFTDMVERQ